VLASADFQTHISKEATWPYRKWQKFVYFIFTVSKGQWDCVPWPTSIGLSFSIPDSHIPAQRTYIGGGGTKFKHFALKIQDLSENKI